MGYIYKITNKLNNKVYIGQTSSSIEERWSSHIRDAKKIDKEKRPLYNAINKYGPDSFIIEELEEINDNLELLKKEIYWIEYFDTYRNGYNATLGGDGICLYDHQEILSLIQENKTSKEISEKLGCCVDIIRDIANRNNVRLTSSNFKQIAQYDLNNNYIQTFATLGEAARWLVENDYSKVSDPTNTGSIKSHIGEVAKGRRKTAYKHIWKYV